MSLKEQLAQKEREIKRHDQITAAAVLALLALACYYSVLLIQSL